MNPFQVFIHSHSLNYCLTNLHLRYRSWPSVNLHWFSPVCPVNLNIVDSLQFYSRQSEEFHYLVFNNPLDYVVTSNWGYNSVVESLSTMCRPLGSTCSMAGSKSRTSVGLWFGNIFQHFDNLLKLIFSITITNPLFHQNWSCSQCWVIQFSDHII